MADTPIDLPADFRDLLRAFIDRDVRFLVVGAYALAVLGRPRATGDLDVWVDPTPANARRVYAALADFGAPLSDLTVADLATAGVVFQVGLRPLRVDVLTEISGLSFADAWPRRIPISVGRLAFAVLGRDDFLVNKRASGRLKDLADAERLEPSRPRLRSKAPARTRRPKRS